MRNKKSVLMTLNHNCGCFSGVGGIAGNAQILPMVAVERWVCALAGYFAKHLLYEVR